MRPKTFKSVSSKKYDSMMGRCYRPNDPSYKNYGQRGIRVDSQWIKDIATFRGWLEEELKRLDLKPEQFIQESGKWQIDRIDGNGHYVPNNCRLVTEQHNARNKRGKLREFEAADGSIVIID